VIVCHGAGEFKENYFELCGLLAGKGIAALAIDMHGHGASKGERSHVVMTQWVADVRAAIDFLAAHARVDGDRIGAFGLSSGGTAVLEAAVVDTRLRTLITLDATVRNSLPWPAAVVLRCLVALGNVKKRFTKSDLRIPLGKLSGGTPMAADPEVEKRLHSDPRLREAFMAFPFPGAAEAFFVDTIKRASKIKAPTLVLWGEEDKVDPPETARMLFEALNCRKQLHIFPGNGHVGHLDRNRHQVFALTADWALATLL
jgi:alpha-beta hydrolase superfamily lysophospholipase